MKSKNVTILNYGSGNLLSVKRAFEYCGANVQVTNNPKVIKISDRLVIPGVGAFSSGINAIKKKNIFDPLIKFNETQRPLLGICLGMQLFATKSHEFGSNKGLDIIPGEVIKIKTKTKENHDINIPHIGWAEINFKFENINSKLTMSDIDNTKNFYYMAHSYQFVPDKSENIMAHCFYGGHKIVAAIHHENVTGFQFHPEKSANQGLELLNKFLKI